MSAQTPRQKEIQALARAYVKDHPYATQNDVAEGIGVDPPLFHRYRKAGRIDVEIPAHAAFCERRARRHRTARGLDATRPAV